MPQWQACSSSAGSYIIKNNLIDEKMDYRSCSLMGHHSCVESCLFSTEVLLDMRASGSELGWLTWPVDLTDKQGVSVTPVPGFQVPCFHFELASGFMCMRKSQAEFSASSVLQLKIFSHLPLFNWLFASRMSVFYSESLMAVWIWICERSQNLIRRLSSLQSMSGLHR